MWSGRGRGTTLPEVLVVTALSVLLLGTVGGALQLVLSTYRKGDRELPAFRRAAEGVAWVARDLESCKAIYAPEPARLHVGVTLGEVPLVWARRDETGAPVRVAYVRQESGRLVRALYGPDADPRVLGKAVAVQPLPALAAEVKVLYVPGRVPWVRLYAPAPGAAPLWTRVNLRGAYEGREEEEKP